MFEDTTVERQRVREAGQAALDWHKLYQWTMSQPAGTVLGRSCTNSDDPLGKYLSEVAGTPNTPWSVGPSLKTSYGDRLQKPEWVNRLILATDSATGHTSGEVTREVYLQILERVKPARVSKES